MQMRMVVNPSLRPLSTRFMLRAHHPDSTFDRQIDTMSDRSEMVKGAFVDSSLETDHIVEGVPEIHPSIVDELGIRGSIQAHGLFRTDQAKKEPHLLLTDADRLLVGADAALG